MKPFGLYLPIYFKHQHYDNYYNIPIERLEKHYFIPIEYFRYLYKDNKNVFNQITKELVLRGGEFFLENESPLFPKVSFTNNKLITLNNDIPEESYKKIDYEVLGIKQFIKLFNIENNNFFEHVPLEGFKVLNLSNLNLLYLEKKLLDCGFSIINSKNNSKSIKHKKGFGTTYKNDDANRNSISNDKTESTLHSIEVSNERLFNVVNGIKENPFYRYIKCSEINLKSNLVEILNCNHVSVSHLVNNNQQLKLLNKKQNKDLAIKLDTILLDYDLIASKTIEFVNDNPSLRNIKINTLLNDNVFNMFRQYAYKNGVIYLGDLTTNKTTKILSSKGIGKSKIYSFLNIVFSLTKVEKNTSEAKATPNIINKSEPKFLAYSYIKSPKLRKYLVENEITYLSNTEIEHLIQSKIGKRKERNTLLNTYKTMIDTTKNCCGINIVKEGSIHLTIREILYTLHLDYLIDELENINLLNKEVDILLNNYDSLPHDLKTITKMYFESIDFFENLSNNPLEVIRLKEEEQIIFNNRINTNEKKTLEEVGKLAGKKTRERIRQIEKKIKNTIINLIDIKLIDIYKKYLEKNNIETLDNINLKNIFLSIDKNYFYYDSYLNKFTHKKYEAVSKDIKQAISAALTEKDVFYLSEFIEFICSFSNNEHEPLINLYINNIHSILESLNYIVKGNTVIKRNITKEKLYVHIIKTYYANNVLDLSDEYSMNDFLQKLSMFAPKKMIDDLKSRENNDLIRSIEAILERHNEVVLKLDAHQYRMLDVNNVPYKLMDNIYDFIREEIVKNEFVSVKKIYRAFTGEINNAGYTEKTVYNLLKLLFEDEFYFTGKTTLRIYNKDADVKTTYEIIVSTLKKNNNFMKTEDLSNEIGAEDYTIHQQADNELLQISNGHVYLRKNKVEISKGALNAIKSTFNNYMNRHGFVPIKKVFKEIKFDLEVYSELLKKEFNSLDSFTALLKKIYPETEGHTRILFKKGDSQDYFKVYISELNQTKEIHREDFFKAGDQLGFSEPTNNMYLKKFIEIGQIVPINSDYFALPKHLEQNDILISNINNFLLKRFADKDYLSLSSIKFNFDELPELNNYRWSMELLNYYATHILKYNKVVIKEMRYDHDPMIIKKPDSNLNYNEIVKLEISDFNGNRTEDNILVYMIEKGLLRSKAKSLYKWFFTKDILVKNNFGRIYLRNELQQR